MGGLIKVEVSRAFLKDKKHSANVTRATFMSYVETYFVQLTAWHTSNTSSTNYLNLLDDTEATHVVAGTYYLVPGILAGIAKSLKRGGKYVKTKEFFHWGRGVMLQHSLGSSSDSADTLRN